MLFRSYRPDNGLDKYWHTVRADSWPANAPQSTTEVSKLAERIVDELVNKFENEIFQFVTNDVDPNGNLFWDTDWFLSEKDTVDNVEKFYNQLRLSDFNPEWIAVYRDAWLKKAGSVPLSKLVSAW